MWAIKPPSRSDPGASGAVAGSRWASGTLIPLLLQRSMPKTGLRVSHRGISSPARASSFYLLRHLGTRTLKMEFNASVSVWIIHMAAKPRV
jgi:hypothetical protein